MNQFDMAGDPSVPTDEKHGLHWRSIQKTGVDRDPEFWRRMHQEHGDVIHFTGPQACTGLASIEMADSILRRDNDQMSRGLFLNTLGKIMLGRRSLVSLEGAEYRSMRGLWAPTFTTSAIRSEHAAPIARYASVFADELGTTEPLDILEAMSDITMRTATRILLGEHTEKQADEFSSSTYEMLETQMEVTRHPMGIAPALLLKSLVFLRARSRMRATIAEVLDQIATPGRIDSFLGRLASHRDAETGRGLTRSELIDTGVASLAAATHTTSLLLSWTFHLLSSRPDLDEEAHAEIVGVCGRNGADAESVGRVRELGFCRMLLLESMRLYPPLWILHRTPKQDYEALGHTFRGGRLISIPVYAIHRDPRHYENPSEFQPQRWRKKPPRGAYLPFGAGGRSCLGESLAMTQALIILSIFLARFRITAETTEVRPVGCGYLLKASPVLKMRLRPRQGAVTSSCPVERSEVPVG
jgi:pentalenene oxygenase